MKSARLAGTTRGPANADLYARAPQVVRARPLTGFKVAQSVTGFDPNQCPRSESRFCSVRQKTSVNFSLEGISGADDEEATG
jgi:hypothetical protein